MLPIKDALHVGLPVKKRPQKFKSLPFLQIGRPIYVSDGIEG
jgi:hypothetical protein